MMETDQFARTRLLIGPAGMERLKKATVAVFGLGGVGGHVCDALARTGIGHMVIVDKDTVSLSNLNRQIIALHSTVGRAKAEVMKEHLLDINPDLEVEAKKMFYLPENAGEFDFAKYDYVVDAVDTVTAKLSLIEAARKAGTPIISAMGAGDKRHPEMLRVSDISQTSVDPLSRVMRHELRKRGISHLKVVWSPEPPSRPYAPPASESWGDGKKDVPGSVAFVPSVAGLIIASVVVNDLVGGSEADLPRKAGEES